MGRRQFVNSLLIGGGAGLMPGPSVPVAVAEPPAETATLRMDRVLGVCTAPQYVTAELLKSEGFTDVHDIKKELPYGRWRDDTPEGAVRFYERFLTELTKELKG